MENELGIMFTDLQGYVLVDLGWVDFDFCVPPSCPAASAKFPSAQAELGRQWNTQNPSQQNPVSAHLGHPVLVPSQTHYIRINHVAFQ